MTIPYQQSRALLGAFALSTAKYLQFGSNSPLSIVWESVGPDGVPILVRGDGHVVFDFEQSNRFSSVSVDGYQPVGGQKIPAKVQQAEALRQAIMYDRLNYMNAWQFCFSSSIATVGKFGARPPAPVNAESRLGGNYSGGHWNIFQDGRPCVVNRVNPDGWAIGADVLDHTLGLMIRSSEKYEGKFLDVFPILYLSTSLYSSHQFSASLILSWSVCEKILNLMWVDYQERCGEHTALGGSRKKLLNGKDFTASIVSQILSLGGAISDDRLGKIDLVRKARNNFAHSLKEVDVNIASDAIQLSSAMMSEILGERVKVHASRSFWF